jgi:hypothetical protein
MLLLRFLLLIILLSSCGSDKKAEVELAKQKALTCLTVSDYNCAITTLEAIGRQDLDAKYLKLLASAYAGRSGYNTSTLFGTDIPKIGSPSILGGFARFTTSPDMDAPDNDNYDDLMEAITILLHAGGIPLDKDPTVARRALLFNKKEASEINSFLMYLLMAAIGKFTYFYGNSDPVGVKGGGTSPEANGCFVNYANTTAFNPGPGDISTWLAGGLTGTCTSLNDGKIEMGPQNDLDTKYLCQGAILLNNFLEVFPVVVSNITGTNFSTLTGIQAAVTAATSAVTANDLSGAGLVLTYQSLSRCMTDFDPNSETPTDQTNDDPLENYYALLMEVMFQ